MSDSQPKKNNNKRKKKLKSDEAFGPWIVSYADTVTLLLCFFVIFYAEQKKPAEPNALIEITADLMEGSQKQGAAKSINPDYEKLEFVDQQNEILIRLYEEDFFEVGAFSLKPQGLRVLARIADKLMPYQEKIFIQFEGHTDSLKVSDKAYYRGNLGLSSLRAAEAAQVFIDKNMSENKVKVSGYGSSRPLVSDRSPASEGGRYLAQAAKKNRRVELRVTTDEALNFAEVFELKKIEL